MKSSRIKIISLALSVFMMGIFAAPTALAAVECDADADGYIVVPSRIMRVLFPDTPYDENGNYGPAEWQDYFKMFKNAKLTENEQCIAMNFKKGAEPSRCDGQVLGVESNVYDPSKVDKPVRGSQVNPGAVDAADNGIDEDCDGEDKSLFSGTGGGKDIGGLVPKVIDLFSKLVVVVSIVIMIWGGVLYATAAGDEARTSKARKAIIGAIIGLIVGLLAPTVVNMIAASLG